MEFAASDPTCPDIQRSEDEVKHDKRFLYYIHFLYILLRTLN